MIPITAFLIETFTTRQLFLYAMGIFAGGLGGGNHGHPEPGGRQDV